MTGTSDSAWSAFSEAYHLYSHYDANARIDRQTVWSGGTDYAVWDYLYDAVGRPTCGIAI